MKTVPSPLPGVRAKRPSWLVPLCALFGVCVLSFLPVRDKRALHTKGRLHVWGHAAVFGCLAFLFVRPAQSWKGRIVALLGMLALGAGIEYAQHVINVEPLERFDVLTDSVSILIGFLCALLSESRETAERAG